jgi:hypothetical protein
MSQFEFFMTFYGLLLGLAVAELLSGFGNLLRARAQPCWGILTPLLGLCIFINIVACFADAWRGMTDVTIDFRGVTVPSLIGVALFTSALMAVPKDIEEWPSLDDYFMARRRFTVGGLLVPMLLSIFPLELFRVMATPIPAQIAYWIINAALVGLMLVALLARSRRNVAIALAVLSAFLMLLYAVDLKIADWVAYFMRQ